MLANTTANDIMFMKSWMLIIRTTVQTANSTSEEQIDMGKYLTKPVIFGCSLYNILYLNLRTESSLKTSPRERAKGYQRQTHIHLDSSRHFN